METKVIEFLEKTSNIVGGYRMDSFRDNTESEFDNLVIESPIEQMLYCALKCLRELNDIMEEDPFEVNGKLYMYGLRIDAQIRIGKYRVDFLVTMYRIKEHNQAEKSVIVECDSQEWHERSEQQRRYEKKRDRYFALNDYTIFHYTGKEILKEPFRIAEEIFSYVMEIDPDVINTPGDD